jgi:hypothetical protein
VSKIGHKLVNIGSCSRHFSNRLLWQGAFWRGAGLFLGTTSSSCRGSAARRHFMVIVIVINFIVVIVFAVVFVIIIVIIFVSITNALFCKEI